MTPDDKIRDEFNAAIDYAVDVAGMDAALFLGLWREGNWDEMKSEFPDFEGPIPDTKPRREDNE